MGVENVGENEAGCSKCKQQVRNPAPGRRTSPPKVLQESLWMRVCCAVVVGCFSLWLGCRPDALGIGNPGDDALNQKEQGMTFLNYNRRNDLLAPWPLLEDMDQGNRVCSCNNYGYFSGTCNKTCLAMSLGYMQYSIVRSAQCAMRHPLRRLELTEGGFRIWRWVQYDEQKCDLLASCGNTTEQDLKPDSLLITRKHRKAGIYPHATPNELTPTQYKSQRIGVLHLSNKIIVVFTSTLGTAALVSLLAVLYCRYQRRIRDQENTFLRSIESPIPDVPIVNPLRAIAQEWQDVVEMAAIHPEPRVQPAECTLTVR